MHLLHPFKLYFFKCNSDKFYQNISAIELFFPLNTLNFQSEEIQLKHILSPLTPSPKLVTK